MKITRIDVPFPAIMIDDFFPSPAMVRSAAASFDLVRSEDWVRYGMQNSSDGQVQYCSSGRPATTPEALLVMDYIATYFDPNKAFEWITTDAFPDISHYGGGMMSTPNSKGEGGYLGMHVDAGVHGANHNWKREYSVILGLSEKYDSSFDLLLHNGTEHARVPYKFNRLWSFKCSENSWHGVREITKGLDRKTLGVMYWSLITGDERHGVTLKAKFNNELNFS